MIAAPLLALLLLGAGPMAATPTGRGVPAPPSTAAVPASAPATPPEPIVGGPCEGCQAVFQGRPATLGWSARIAPPDEPGESLLLEGVVRRTDGSAAAGVIVYAYHTDAKGNYPADPRLAGTAAGRHGRLRGFARTDTAGRYRFETIRPASYPGTEIPQHVHMHVVEPGRCTYYIDDIHFADDPHLTPAARRQADQGRGGSGIVTPTRDSEGRWQARRDIVLGQGITDYDRCAAAAPKR